MTTTGITLSNLIVRESVLLREAIKVLNDAGRQLLLCVDLQDRLVGILTDGDLRRHLLRYGSLDVPTYEVMNRNFSFLPEHARGRAKQMMEETKKGHMPIVDEEGRPVDLVTLNDFIKLPTPKKEGWVVIMAGGKGTRLEPISRIIPKPLIPVGDKTVLEVVMEKFAAFGYNKFIITLNYKRELVKAYFADKELPYEVIFLEEPDQYLGTVGSLAYLKERLAERFILSNCDIFADLDYEGMFLWHKEHGADMTLLGIRTKLNVPYGVLELDDRALLTDFVEKPNYQFMVNTGIYIIEPEIIELIPKGQTFEMNHLIQKALDLGKRITCYPIEDRFYDAGQFSEYEKILLKFNPIGLR